MQSHVIHISVSVTIQKVLPPDSWIPETHLHISIKSSGAHIETELTNWLGLFQTLQTHAPWQICPREDSERHSEWTLG